MIGVRRRGARRANDADRDGTVKPPATADAAAERACWLALSAVPGMGPVGFARLRREYGSIAAAWDAGEAALRDLPRLPPEAIPTYLRLRRAGAERVARRLEAATQRAGGRIVIAVERQYPAQLRTVPAPPPVLHVAGDAAAFADRGVAIVGTRRASGYGLSTAIEIADELARVGVSVISGLALGIDGAAHRGALAAGGRTIAVLPSSLDRVYPPRHRSLAAEIVRAGGALVTEVATGRRVGRPDFARRNRIIAGLSEAVVVVEAPDGSGALLTASAASELERELYVVPGQIDTAVARGSNRLIADKQADLVTSPEALIQRIGMVRGVKPPAVKTLSEAEGLVLGNLLKRSGSIEELIDRTRLETPVVASALTLLETRGLVSTFGGATFHPTLAARKLAGFV